MAGEGWAEYIDQRGKPCAYCGEPSTHTLVLEGDQYKQNKLVKRGKRVGVCDQHVKVVDGGISPALGFRRRKAKGVQQLSLDPSDQGGIRDAIYGNDP